MLSFAAGECSDIENEAFEAMEKKLRHGGGGGVVAQLEGVRPWKIRAFGKKGEE